MFLPFLPDVRSMYNLLFPGGELIGEGIALLRDSYEFLSARFDTSDGGRAIVLAVCSLGMSIVIMIQRRLGNVRSVLLILLGFLSFHGTMVSLMGLPWFAYPVIDHLFRNGYSSTLVMGMSALSVVTGWGRHCLPEGSLFRDHLAGRFGFNSQDDDFDDGSSSAYSYLLFGLIATGLGMALFRY